MAVNKLDYYMKSLPNYQEVLTDEQLTRLASYYKEYAAWQTIADRCFNMAMNNKAGIDYSNDWNKASYQALKNERILKDEANAMIANYYRNLEENTEELQVVNGR